MLAALRGFLGEAGFFWLSACAVYPVLDWRLTLYLGEALTDSDGGKLLHPDRLLALVRTPWLRQGFMPDWFRLRLIDGLSPGQERQVREALGVMLTTALNGPVDGLALEVARPYRRTLASLAGRLLRSRKAAAREGLPEDRVFRSFMDSRLAVRLPRSLGGLLLPRSVPAPSLRLGNPWENRRKIGTIRAFFATIWLFTVSPRRAYDLTQERGRVLGAFNFALVISILFGIPDLLPNSQFLSLDLWSSATFFALGVFIQGAQSIVQAAFLHESLRITGGLPDSKAGFNGSYRVLCYTEAITIWWIVPSALNSSEYLQSIIFFLIAFWQCVLTTYGVMSLHRTRKRRVVLVVAITSAVYHISFLYLLMPGINEIIVRFLSIPIPFEP
jgi:hypothetical protein